MKIAPRPSFALPGAPPPLPPRTKQILDAVNEINELLTLAYQSPSVAAYVNRVTVQSALEMWQGKEPEVFVSAEEINSCEGVKAVFPIVKKLEAICDSIPMKVPVDHIQFCLWKLSDEYQISMFGAEFCRANHLLRGRLKTPSERLHSTSTRTPSFILAEGEDLSNKFVSATKNKIPPPPSSPPPAVDSGGIPLPPPMNPPPSSLLPPPRPPPQTPGPIRDEDVFKALQSSEKVLHSNEKVVNFDLAKNSTNESVVTAGTEVTTMTKQLASAVTTPAPSEPIDSTRKNVNAFVVEAETVPVKITPTSAAIPSATSVTGGVNSPFPSPTPMNTPSEGKSPMAPSTNTKSTAASKKNTSPWPILATVVIPCLISLSFAFLTVLLHILSSVPSHLLPTQSDIFSIYYSNHIR